MSKSKTTADLPPYRRPKPRKITQELLEEFLIWTHTAPMFHTSPEGEAFGLEMRAVIELAEKALKTDPQTTGPAHWLRVDNAADEHTFGLKVRDGVVTHAPFSVREFIGQTEADARAICLVKGWTVETA